MAPREIGVQPAIQRGVSGLEMSLRGTPVEPRKKIVVGSGVTNTPVSARSWELHSLGGPIVMAPVTFIMDGV